MIKMCEELICFECGKKLKLEEENWWGPFVYCPVCDKKIMDEYRDFQLEVQYGKAELDDWE